jgi:hypothetical protein
MNVRNSNARQEPQQEFKFMYTLKSSTWLFRDIKTRGKQIEGAS